MTFPDRISSLIQKLEAGQPVTRDDVRQTAALQALDLLKIGEDFVRESFQRDRDHMEAMRQNEIARRE